MVSNSDTSSLKTTTPEPRSYPALSSFKTKKALHEFVSGLIEKLGLGSFPEGSPEFGFFYQLCQGHPNWAEKSRNGVRVFAIRGNGARGRGLGLFLVDSWGVTSDISWNKAITGRGADPDALQRKKMRDAVVSQILAFKASQEQVCQLCGVRGVPLEVDHVVSFKELAAGFTGSLGEWVHSHKVRAVLQLLCIPCHKSKNTCKSIPK